MQADVFLAALETRRQLCASMRDRQTTREARGEAYHLQMERCRVGIAQSRKLLAQPVITMTDIQRRPH